MLNQWIWVVRMNFLLLLFCIEQRAMFDATASAEKIEL